MSCLFRLRSSDVDSELLVSLAKIQYTRDDEPGMGTVGQLMDNFVALCIVVMMVSLIKIVASNENIEWFREYFAVGYRAPDPSFF